MKAILATGLSLSLATGVRLLVPGPSLPALGQRLGWMLVHSIWQVTLLALVAGLLLACLRRHSARLRYNLAVLCLALMLVAPAMTWSMVSVAPPAAVPAANESPGAQSLSLSPIDRSSPVNGAQIETAAMALGPAPLLTDDGRVLLPNIPAPASVPEVLRPSPATAPGYGLEQIRQLIVPWLGQIIAIWLAGVLCCAFRPVVGLWTQWRLQQTGLVAVAAETQRLMSDLARRMNVTPTVRIAESALVYVPMVVGYLRPIILLPASVLVGMTPDQMASLLAHELAHIRRHDWIVNAIQVVIETLMFYHPAIWWLSHRIRCERELCCDDLALAVIGDKLAYARMLLALEELRHTTPLPVTALAAAGGEFVQRIRRLLPRVATPERAERGWLGGILALGLLAAFFVGWLTTTRSDAEPQQAVTKETEPKTEPLSSQQGQGIVIRGRIVTANQSPLPPDLKLQRRITGSNFAEQVKDVELINGQFTISVDYEAAFVRLYATSKEFAPSSTPRFEVKRGQQVDPVVITMGRGSTARLNLRSEAGTHPRSGTATVTLRNVFEPDLGTFAIDANGQVMIEHCPAEPVQVDLYMPGFEEQRVHRRLDSLDVNDVTIRPTKPARFQVVDAGGQPIAGAKVRLYSRVRADSFMRPRTEWGDGPVWGVSDADGRVELTTLCAIDPVPTNDPGPADYAFRIDAPGQAPYYVGPVRAGSDLGQIQLSKALRVDGEIIRDAAQPERVNVQWRQATLEQGASTGKANWTTAKLVETDGRLLLKLTDLQPGRFDLFVTYSDPNVPENQVGGTIKQLEFHGTLTNDSAGLKIARDTVTPGDKHLTAARASLFPIDDMPPSNLPEHAVRQFDPRVSIAGNGVPTRSGREGGAIVANERARFSPLLAWSHTAPIQHSMGYVDWHLIILDDGTVIVPPSHSHDIGAHHRLSPSELRLLTALLDKYPDFWGKQVPSSDPELGNWRHGSESIVYSRKGKPKAFHAWDVSDEVLDPKIADAKETITFQLKQIILEAKCGGRAALEKYRDLAARAFLTAYPNAKPLNDSDGYDWCHIAIEPDGSRQIECGNSTANSRVSLVHPIGGEPYVEYVEFQNQRTVAVVPLEVIQPKVDRPAMRIAGTVQDEKRRPIPHAQVVLCLVNASDDGGQSSFVAAGHADEQGQYILDVPEKSKELYHPKTKAVVWAMADKFGTGIVCYSLAGQPPVSQPLSVAKSVEISIRDEGKQSVTGQVIRLDLDNFQVPPQFLERMLVTRDKRLVEIKQMPSKFLDGEFDSTKVRTLQLKTQAHGVQSFTWRTDMTAVGNDQDGVELTVRPLATFSGQFVALPTVDVGNLVVEVETFNGESSMKQPWCSGLATTTTDASGRFELQVATGQLRRFHIRRPANALWRPLIQSRDEIVLRPGDNPSIKIPLVQTRKLRGTVRRPNGDGIRGVEFSVAHGHARTTVLSETMRSDRSEFRETVVTNADGLFSVDVVPGDIQVSWLFTPGGDFSSAELWPDQTPQPIQWSPEKMIVVPEDDHDFELPAITLTTCFGTLLDEFGRPLEGVIIAGGQGRGLGHSDANGKFEFDVMGRATEWTVAAEEETGDFGLPRPNTPLATIVRESPLVLQVPRQAADR